MAEIYRLDRAGGPDSPRFRAYLAHMGHHHALAAYNPMAGPAALATVERLLELDAEAIAGRHAEESEIAVVVSSPGLWTDRIATDPAALALGWTPLGLPWHAGYRWAIARANGAL
jgi:hypothetical protein